MVLAVWPYLALAQGMVAHEQAPQLQQAEANWPDDDQLEVLGVRIGAIRIQVDDIFDLSNPEENSSFYRAANYLHIETRESTIRPQLLFKSGDLFSHQLLEETARNLRARKYLADAAVTVEHFDPKTKTVDLLVRVHDNWTLAPGVSFSRSGGKSRSGIQLDESNLLGLGKSLSIDYSQNVDRAVMDFTYRDSNLMNSRWELSTTYQRASDGGLQSVSLVRPFYSLDTRWSAGLDVLNQKRTDYRFVQGISVDQYQTQLNHLNIQGGWSTGLRASAHGPSWVQRWSLGLALDRQRFSPDPVIGTTLLPVNQDSRYPWMSWSWLEDHYVIMRNRDQIDRVEDVYLGRALSLQAGYAAKAWGADRNALITTISAQTAYQLNEQQLLFLDAGVSSRVESSEWLGTVLGANARYDWQQSKYRILVVKFSHAQLKNPDDSQQLYLGSDEGLRGYALRYRSGTQRSVWIIEQRAYTDWQLWRLLSVGGVAFMDVGQINSGELTHSQNTYMDIGIGLRLGNIRSSRGEVFHLDLAYPFNAATQERNWQFSITTKSSF
jgi:hypothetical protein